MIVVMCCNAYNWKFHFLCSLIGKIYVSHNFVQSVVLLFFCVLSLLDKQRVTQMCTDIAVCKGVESDK